MEKLKSYSGASKDAAAGTAMWSPLWPMALRSSAELPDIIRTNSAEVNLQEVCLIVPAQDKWKLMPIRPGGSFWMMKPVKLAPSCATTSNHAAHSRATSACHGISVSLFRDLRKRRSRMIRSMNRRASLAVCQKSGWTSENQCRALAKFPISWE